VRAIIAMARSLKLELIAEGVETAEQLAFLQQQDCHTYQGYYFSRAVAETAFCQLLVSTSA
jgi:EAL domain-containing protein (putative c-di-GMP-specific phosphodiesterase class I)